MEPLFYFQGGDRFVVLMKVPLSTSQASVFYARFGDLGSVPLQKLRDCLLSGSTPCKYSILMQYGLHDELTGKVLLSNSRKSEERVVSVFGHCISELMMILALFNDK